MPATINPEPDVAVVVMGHVRSSSPFGSDTTDLCTFKWIKIIWEKNTTKCTLKRPHHKDHFFQYLRSDGEIWAKSQTYEPEQICWNLPVLLWQVTEGWIQEGSVSAGMLGPLPTAFQQAGQFPLEVSLSELMVASCLAVAEVLGMEKPGGLAPMLRGKEALHVASGHTKELSHYFRWDSGMNQAPVIPFTDIHHVSETGATAEKMYIKETPITWLIYRITLI